MCAFAALQLASAGISAIADGLFEQRSAAGTGTHIEAVTQPACRPVHSLDCALCRYISLSACKPPAPAAFNALDAARATVGSQSFEHVLAPAANLPHGRAPPTI